MKLGFNREALAWAVLLFGVEVLIATVWVHYRWLRGFFGDLLAVIWVYSLFCTVVRADHRVLALAAWLAGCAVELGQYLATLNGWHTTSPLLRIVWGSVADWWDVVAYSGGFCAILVIEWARRRAIKHRRGPA